MERTLECYYGTVTVRNVMLEDADNTTLVDGIEIKDDISIMEIYEHYDVEAMSIDLIEKLISDYNVLYTKKELSVSIIIPEPIVECIKSLERGISDEKIRDIFSEFVDYGTHENVEDDLFDIFIEERKDDFFD
jgi:hypothetical protein